MSPSVAGGSWVLVMSQEKGFFLRLAWEAEML